MAEWSMAVVLENRSGRPSEFEIVRLRRRAADRESDDLEFAAQHWDVMIPKAVRSSYRHDSADPWWPSSVPPFPGGCGTAHVGTPRRGSSHTCSTHHKASTAMNVHVFSMSALICVAIEQLPHAFASALPDGIGQRCRPCVTAEANGFAQTVD